MNTTPTPTTTRPPIQAFAADKYDEPRRNGTLPNLMEGCLAEGCNDMADTLEGTCYAHHRPTAPEYQRGGHVEFTADGRVLHSPPQDHTDGSVG